MKIIKLPSLIWKKILQKLNFESFCKFILSYPPNELEEDALRYILEHLVDKIPIRRKHPYPYIYRKIEKILKSKASHISWDYLSYFYEHFPKP